MKSIARNTLSVMSALRTVLFHTPLYKKFRSLRQESRYQYLWWLAALSFFTTLHLPYIGEEAVYTITSQEMCFYQSWLKPMIYGTDYGRPPFYNWLIILVTQLTGLSRVLLAARLVSAVMSLLSSGLLYVLVQQLTRNVRLALLSVSIFLSGDLLLRRGWLAYSDPTFAFFCFAACAGLWLAVHKRQCRYLVLAALAANIAFLTKAITGYIFFFGAFAVFMGYKPYRSFLLKPRVMAVQCLLQLLSICLPLGWHLLFSQGVNGTGVIKDIQNQLVLLDVFDYVKKLIFFPVDVWCRFFPTSLLMGIFCIRRWRNHVARFNMLRTMKAEMLTQEQRFFRLTLGITLLNMIPYWLAPQMRIRYILPLYPFVAILLAYGVSRLEQRCLSWVTAGLLATLVLRFVLGWFWFPYYEQRYRGNYQEVAADIVALAGDKPVYTDYGASVGVSVVAYINTLRLGKGNQPVVFFDPALEKGLLLSAVSEYNSGDFFKTYQLGRVPLYLFAQY